MISLVATLVFGIVSIFTGGFSDTSNAPIVNVLIMALGLPLLVLELCGIFINWKKWLKGFIAPIPVLSAIIEGFKGIIYAAKGLVVIVKKQDALILGDVEDPYTGGQDA